MIDREQVVVLLRSALHELRQTFDGCRGPGGRVLLVSSSSSGSASACSSTSAVVLNGLLVKNPLSKVILARTVQAQHQQFKDQGLLALHLCLRLVEAALKEGSAGHGAVHAVVNAYNQAVDWLAEYASLGPGSSTGKALGLPCIPPRRNARTRKACSASQQPKHPGRQDGTDGVPQQGQQGSKIAAAEQLLPPVAASICWSHLPTLMAVVRSVIGSKPVAALQGAALEKVVAAVVEAFVTALDPSPSGQLLAPRVHVVAVPGLPAVDSTLLSGVVLLSGTSGAAARRLLPWAGGRVAVFDISLDVQQDDLMPAQLGAWELPAAQQAVGETAGQNHEGMGQGAVQLQRLLELVERLTVAGAAVVACQKVMHPAVVSALMARGILPLQRLSALHINPFCNATGAITLSTPCPPAAALQGSMGDVGVIEEKVLAGKVYLAVHGPAGRPPARQQSTPPCTLLLGAPSQAAADELKAAVQTALHTLTLGLQVPEVVPGGGCAEALMGTYLRQRAAACSQRGRLQRLQRRAVEVLAEALEEASGQLMGPLQPLPGQGGASAAGLMAAGTCGSLPFRAATQHGSTTAAGAPAGGAGGAPAEVQAGLVPAVQRVRYIGWDHHKRNFCAVAEAEVQLEEDEEAASAGQVNQLRAAHLLDLLAPKMGAVVAAMEAAAAVLMLDGLLLSGDAAGSGLVDL